MKLNEINPQIDKENRLIGSNLFKIRWGKYCSQVDLARKVQVAGLDISKETMCQIENGRRKLYAYEIPYFAKALNMTIEDFSAKLFEKEQ